MRAAIVFAFVLAVGVLLDGFSAVAKFVPERPVIDGKLDDACWAEGWNGGFRIPKNRNLHDIRDRAEYLLAADAERLYFAFRVHCSDMAKVKARPVQGMWVCDTVELFVAPSGTPDDFYQFAVDYQGRRLFAQYYGEAGHITPDPYAPDWKMVVGDTEDGWCAEGEIPFSAFYMTRNQDWKQEWLFNVGFCNRTMDEVTHLIDSDGLKKSKDYLRLSGVPARKPEDDLCAKDVMPNFERVDSTGGIEGTLEISVFVAEAGDYSFRSNYGGGEQSVTLVAGENQVSVKCRYPQRGRFQTDIALTRERDGKTYRRGWPVYVDFEPIMVKLTTPGYRNNFYPGQDTSRVEGNVRVAAKGEKVVLSLEGPGLTRQTATPTVDGRFGFDTVGFKTGDAWLTVVAGPETKRVRIRNLPPSGHRMSWVENKRLVVDGRPGFKCGMGAQGYMGGKALAEKYASEYWYSRADMTDDVCIEPGRLIRGSEQKEGVKDIRPCDEMFRKVDEVIEANRERDFAYYYFGDEPECRGISPVYMRHLYEYIAEKDPYHVVRISSRAPRSFFPACDYLESHNYLTVFFDENGKRDWRVTPAMIADMFADYSSEQPKDKLLGFVTTAFAYLWNSHRNEYPTFDEYVASSFAAVINGAKSLTAYAYHDFADRPSVYYGYQYVNSTVRSLEDLLLADGKTLIRTKACQCARFEAHGESCVVLVNYTRGPQKVSVPRLNGRYFEFRGTRTFDFSSAEPSRFDLGPLEVLVCTSRKRGTDLPSTRAVKARIDSLEEDRCGRDNQLFWRLDDIVFETPEMKSFVNSTYKFVDGTRDVLGGAWSGGTNYVVGLSFANGFRPQFDTVRVYGLGVDGLQVDVRRGDDWVTLCPIKRHAQRYSCELVFAETVRPYRMRLRFTHPKVGANRTELYEIELPQPLRPLDDEVVSKSEKPSAVASAKQATGVLWRFDDVKTKTNYWSQAVGYDAKHPWLVMDATFKTLDPKGYVAWVMGTKKSRIGGQVRRFVDGLYTFPVPVVSETRDYLRLWLYNVSLEADSISCVERPDNLLSAQASEGSVIGKGSRIKVRLELAAPCDDVTASFALCGKRVAFAPFKVNGRDDIEMKAVDSSRRVWESDISVSSCDTAGSTEVFVKATVLGGALKKPILTNFVEAFE